MKKFDLESYLSDLKQLCAIDSGYLYGPGAEAVADFFETRYQALGLKTERRHYDNNPNTPFLLVSNSDEEDFDVLFLAHMDTVFPVGAAAEWPLTETEQGIVSGPGCADCKGGCLLVYYTIRQLMEEGKCNFRFRIAMRSPAPAIPVPILRNWPSMQGTALCMNPADPTASLWVSAKAASIICCAAMACLLMRV